MSPRIPDTFFTAFGAVMLGMGVIEAKNLLMPADMGLAGAVLLIVAGALLTQVARGSR